MILYRLAHFTLGTLSKSTPLITPIFIAYQLIQLYTNTRIFIHDGSIRSGNSILHTSFKLFEFGMGRILN